MELKEITLPELALIAGTRAALGAGIGLLLADCLSQEHRRAVGWTLVAVGVVTTLPLMVQVFGSCRGKRDSAQRQEPAALQRG